jgi:hypothetical protein
VGCVGCQEGAIANEVMQFWLCADLSFSLCLSIIGRGDDGRLGMCSRGFSVGDEFLVC